MVSIFPFRGTRYNPERVTDLNRVTAPPYDLISAKDQECYYAKHEYNFIRLDLGKEYPTDTENDNRYTRAVGYFREWKKNGILIRDERPAIYFCAQVYKIRNRSGCRVGIISSLRLEELGNGVYPHEKTFSEPKLDRLNLLRASRTNFSCIMGIYTDPEQTLNRLFEERIMGLSPLMEVTDESGLNNKIWRVYDPGIIDRIQKALGDKPVLIADGHHRYESSLRYRDEARQTGRPAEHVMFYLTNSSSHGFEILPIHRMVMRYENFSLDRFVQAAGEFFHVTRIPNPEFDTKPILDHLGLERPDGAEIPGHRFGLQTDGGDFLVLTLRSEDVLKNPVFDGVPEQMRPLDVVILHRLIFDKLLGIKGQDHTEKGDVQYMVNEEEMMKHLRAKETRMALFLRPVPYPTVDEIARSGIRLPQKTTYFFPKLTSGLLMNEL